MLRSQTPFRFAYRIRLRHALVSRPAASRRGVNLLEWAGQVVPQGPIVTGVKNVWKASWLTLMRELAPQSDDGEFVRSPYSFHNNIGADPTFPVEEGRYHVYHGNACPWCHRILLAIVVLGLEDVISTGHLEDDPEKASRGGWVFSTPDPVTGCTDLRGVYDKCSSGFTGRCTAPLLIDKKQMRIVSNDSAQMLRNINEAGFKGGTNVQLYPDGLRDSIEALNHRIYEHVNNGVYKCGFATTQKAYDQASDALFNELQSLNDRLSSTRFLLGDRFTEADILLYPTMIRFDSIYATVFRCSKQRLHEFQHLCRWLADIYSIEISSSRLQIRDTIDIADARRSYSQLFPINPSGIVVAGADGLSPAVDVVPREETNSSMFHLRREADGRIA